MTTITEQDNSSSIILVVDDDPSSLGVIVEYLKGHGFQIVISQDGESGLKRAEYARPDLILLDVTMPGIDGFETCRRLKANEHTREIPVIFLTALSDTVDKIKGFEAGGVDYITKPFQEAEVIVRIETHLRLRRMQERLESQNDRLRREITLREQAEKERRDFQHRLQQARKAESLGRMAGAVAHHFNNMLFVVLGNLEIMREDLPLQSEIMENLEEAEKSARKAADMGRLMLTYVGETAGKSMPCNLSEEVSRIAPLIETAMPDNVSLELELAAGLPDVNIGFDNMRRIVMNLFENACESLDGGPGTVRIVTGKTSCDRESLEQAAWVEARTPGEYVYIEVVDEGCGMDAETIERMFDPFFTTKFTGRGLGLASVAGIVRTNGGAIQVSSRSGAGAAVRVLFPAGFSRQSAVRSPQSD